MKKKVKKIVHYRYGAQKFNTFRELKWHMYLNMQKNTKDNAYQMCNDEILKEYEFNKQERRLLCRTIYDYEKINLEKWNNHQTKLFNDG